MVHGGEKTPLRNKFAFRVRSEERRNLLFVLLRFHAACGIEQMSARFDQTDLRVQNLFLKRRDFVQTFCIETAQRIRTAARNSRVGTRNIQKDEVETLRIKRRMNGVRFGCFHGFQSQAREVFAHRFEPRGGAVGGGEFRISSARVEQHHRLSAGCGAGVENASAESRPAQRNAH